ncbi:MAG: protein tyrosine phosphatase family protein [Gammaproteobacteria bacterium]
MKTSTLQGILHWTPLSDRLATGGQPSEDELVALAAAGYETVVNLGLSEAPYALDDEQGMVQALGLEYLHLPVAWEQPDREGLERFFALMRRVEHRRVFLHCAANKRVSVFMALYRILEQGWPAEDALAAIRDVWEPNEVWERFLTEQLAGHDDAGR